MVREVAQPEEAPTGAHGREAIPMRRLQEAVKPAAESQGTSADTHERTAV